MAATCNSIGLRFDANEIILNNNKTKLLFYEQQINVKNCINNIVLLPSTTIKFLEIIV